MFSSATLAIDAEKTAQAIENAIRRQVTELRRRGVVVGLSGGIDSLVVTCLCIRALGAERVLALFMPERASSPESLTLGRMITDKFGIPAAVEDIAPTPEAAGCYARQTEAIQKMFPEYGDGWRNKITLPSILDSDRLNVSELTVESPSGEQKTARMPLTSYLQMVAATNFKQRVRKMMEYYHADRLNYAVAGTPNRLAYDQGFFVKLGDGAADLKPIAHLYKSQVYALAEYVGVPAEIRRRPPTTDTFSLPQTQEEFYFAPRWTSVSTVTTTRSRSRKLRPPRVSRLNRSSGCTRTSTRSAAPRATCTRGPCWSRPSPRYTTDMCGIAGVMLRRAAAPPEFDELGVMAGALSHRGPDEVGMPRPRPSRARPLPHAFALHLAVRRRCLLDPLRCRWAWANEIAAIFIVRAVQKRSRLGAVARGPLLAASTLAVAALSITVTGSSAIIAAGEVREPQPLTLDMRWSPRAIATTPRYLSTGGSAAVVVSARSEDGEPFEVVVSNLADRDPEGGVRYRAVDLPAGVSATQVSLTTPGGATHSVNRALIDHAASKTELVYWYDLNGRTTAQGPLAKAFAAANAFGLTARGPLLVLVRSERVESSSSAALAQLVAEVARALRPETR